MVDKSAKVLILCYGPSFLVSCIMYDIMTIMTLSCLFTVTLTNDYQASSSRTSFAIVFGECFKNAKSSPGQKLHVFLAGHGWQAETGT